MAFYNRGQIKRHHEKTAKKLRRLFYVDIAKRNCFATFDNKVARTK